MNGETARKKPSSIPRSRPGGRVGGDRRDLPLHRLLAAPVKRFEATAPPSAIGLVFFPLSALLRTFAWSCFPIRCSLSNRAGVVTPRRLHIPYSLLAVRDLQSPAKRLQQRRRQHCDPFLKGRRLPLSHLDILDPLFEVSPSDRVGAAAPMWPQIQTRRRRA